MKNNTTKKTIQQRLLIGAKLGWNTPTLPENIIKFQMNPLIRILRVLAGVITIFLLSIKASSYSVFIFYLALFAFLFFIYHIIILIIRYKHIYKTLNSDKLDVKNQKSIYNRLVTGLKVSLNAPVLPLP